MSWTPISNTPPQYEENGIAASGYYIKFYVAGTTTPTAMATNSTGGTLLDKCQLNSEGYPINGSSAAFLPHIDIKYKIALFRNEADADSNNLANAAWEVDDLFPFFTDASIGTGFGQIPLNTDIVYPVANVTALRALTGITVGQSFYLEGHTNSGIGGGLLLATKTYVAEVDNNGDLFVVDGIVIERPTDEILTPQMFGGILDGVNDDTASFQSCGDTGKSVVITTGILSIDSVTFAGKANIFLEGSASIVLRTPAIATSRGITLQGDESVFIANGLFDGDSTSRSLVKVQGATGCLVKLFNAKRVTAANVGTEAISGIEIEDSPDTYFEIIAEDFQNTGNPNGSNPRIVSINGDSSGYSSSQVRGRAPMVAGVVKGGLTGTNTGRIDVIDLDGCTDNGIYNLNGFMSVGELIYRGSEEAIVQSASLVIDKATIYGGGNTALALDDAQDTHIGSLHLVAENGEKMTPIRTRTGNVTTGRVYIGSLTGDVYDGNICGLNNGTVESITIENVDIKFYYTGVSTTLSSWFDLGNATAFNLGGGSLTFIDTTDALTSSNRPQLALPAVTSGESYISNIDFVAYKNDGTTPSPIEFRITNVAQEFVKTSRLRWQCISGGSGPYARETKYGAPDSITGVANITQAGYWHKGYDYTNQAATSAPFRVRITVGGLAGAATKTEY